MGSKLFGKDQSLLREIWSLKVAFPKVFRGLHPQKYDKNDKNAATSTALIPWIFSKFLGCWVLGFDLTQNGWHQLAPFQAVFCKNKTSLQWMKKTYPTNGERQLIFPTAQLDGRGKSFPRGYLFWCLYIGNDPRIVERLYALKTRCGTAASQVASFIVILVGSRLQHSSEGRQPHPN